MAFRSVRRRIREHLRRSKIRWRARRMGADALWILPPELALPGPFVTDGGEEAVRRACELLAVSAVGNVRYGFGRKSLGTEVQDRDGRTSWIKVDGLRGDPNHPKRSGEIEASIITTVPKPAILGVHEWNANEVHWRALRMTLAPSPAIMATPWLTPAMPRLEPDWVSSLKQALDKVAELPEWRRTVDANELASTIRRRFGIRAASRADEWRPAHGDLHWSNLTAPACMLLDWEDWGTAPRAYDVATLLSYSFGNPTLFRRIEKEFAKELDTQSGIVARLYRYALRLDAVENGISDPREYPLIEVETKRLLRL